MARHNRDGSGGDQRGYEYQVSYQPDWLRTVKVTRDLETGRQSTKILFRNPADHRLEHPGPRVRTGISCHDQKIDVEVAVTDPHAIVTRVRVACRVPDGNGAGEEVEFVLEGPLPPRRP